MALPELMVDDFARFYVFMNGWVDLLQIGVRLECYQTSHFRDE